MVNNIDKSLNFVSLHLDFSFLAVFVDASFAFNRDFSPQLEFIFTLLDKNGNANVIN